MNRVYRLVWNTSLQALVAVSEHTRSKGKCGSKAGMLLSGFLLVSGGASADPIAANTLPTGGYVAAGSASINTQSNTLTVQQNTQRSAINWQSFSIGNNATVNFQQPNNAAVTLNRVVGNQQSIIDGSLNANGRVFLLNASGVLFTQGAQVNVGGLVASTLDISDNDFMAGQATFTGNGSQGSIINLGTINAADSGYVALLGKQVRNEGLISARLGSAILAAGNQISLNFNGDSLVGVTVDQGVLNALVENGQAVYADGGLVVLTAKALDSVMATVVNNTGEIRAQTIANRSGKIYLLGGMDNDRIEVGGTLDASAPIDGDGGFIETSAASVKIKDDIRVNTAAALGLTGTWLIDPDGYTIADSGGDISGSTLAAQLNSTNISIASTSGSSNDGNINVNGPISWSSHKLTLTATNDVNINAVMTASNTAQLDLEPGSGNVNFGFNPDGTFKGRVDFFQVDGVTPRAGTGFLTINNNTYTVITDLGVAGDASSTPGTLTLQGLASVTPNVVFPYWSGGIGGYYALGANIDASATSGWNSGAGFTPIGVGNYTTSFSGYFDGLGHAVSNLTINRPLERDVGLFAFMAGGTNPSVIRNVGLTQANVTGIGSVGTLVGYGYGSWLGGGNYGVAIVRNSFATGTVNGGNGTNVGVQAGGLIGTMSVGTVVNSHTDVTVNVSGWSNSIGGGLVGYQYNRSISDSYALGAVNNVALVGGAQTNSVTGGLVGLQRGSVTNSFATGDVTANRNGAGGLSGYAYGAILNSYATGDVVGGAGAADGEVGGLVGSLRGTGSITTSYHTGTVTTTGGANFGAFVGTTWGNSVQIINSFWNANNGSTATYFDTGTPTISGSSGLALADFQAQASFIPSGSSAGQWDFTDTWFMYEGLTTPMLRLFMTPLTVGIQNGLASAYDGQLYTSSSGLAYSVTPDQSHLLGTLAYTGQNSANVGTYTLTPSGFHSDQLGYLITYASGLLTVNPRPVTVAANSGASRAYDGTTSAVASLFSITNAIGSDSVTLSGSATLVSADVGNQAFTLSGLSVSNSNYTVTGGTAVGTVAVTSSGSVPTNPGIPPTTPPTTSPETPSESSTQFNNVIASAITAGVMTLPTETPNPTTPAQSVFVPPASLPALGNAFGGNTPLMLVSVPAANEPTQAVSLSQVRALLGSASSVERAGGSSSAEVSEEKKAEGSPATESAAPDRSSDIRVPVSRNSLAEIVNGGVKLPSGVEQQLFVQTAQPQGGR